MKLLQMICVALYIFYASHFVGKNMGQFDFWTWPWDNDRLFCKHFRQNWIVWETMWEIMSINRFLADRRLDFPGTWRKYESFVTMSHYKRVKNFVTKKIDFYNKFKKRFRLIWRIYRIGKCVYNAICCIVCCLQCIE